MVPSNLCEHVCVSCMGLTTLEPVLQEVGMDIMSLEDTSRKYFSISSDTSMVLVRTSEVWAILASLKYSFKLLDGKWSSKNILPSYFCLSVVVCRVHYIFLLDVILQLLFWSSQVPPSVWYPIAHFSPWPVTPHSISMFIPFCSSLINPVVSSSVSTSSLVTKLVTSSSNDFA
jgi:hypothetical protein